MTRIFLTKNFSKWADSVGLLDEKIDQTVTEIENGLVDVNLGSNLFKKRIGINNQGKSGSLRTLIGFKAGDNAFFLYGFPKNERGNITKQEKEAFKEMSRALFELSEGKLRKAIESSALREIDRAEEG
ncbi:MAG: type II toxin-antitoxin system RelE/ParE family toxin [Neptuniibacter sp.]